MTEITTLDLLPVINYTSRQYTCLSVRVCVFSYKQSIYLYIVKYDLMLCTVLARCKPHCDYCKSLTVINDQTVGSSTRNRNHVISVSILGYLRVYNYKTFY